VNLRLRQLSLTRARALAGIVVAVMAIPTTAASASSVRYDPGPQNCHPSAPCSPSLYYTADPGEANDLLVTSDATGGESPFGERMIEDSGAAIRPGPGCRAISSNVVGCPAVGVLWVETGDGDDRIRGGVMVVDLGPGDDRVEELIQYAKGGAGNDLLLGPNLDGGPGDDTLNGTLQNDRLDGGSGVDELHGGPGNDILESKDFDESVPPESERPTGDVLDGGDGRDSAVYWRRKVPLVVNLLDPAPDGASGEGDQLRSIESVLGGDAADHLVGDAGANEIVGGGGDDVISGGEGPDALLGGGGRDRVDAGPGADLIDTSGSTLVFDGLGIVFPDYERDVSQEPVECGGGHDLVVRTLADRLLPGCEAIDKDLQISYPRADGRHVVVSVLCARLRFTREGCRTDFVLRAARSACRGVARRTRKTAHFIRPGARRRVRLALPRGCRHGRIGLEIGYSVYKTHLVVDLRPPTAPG